MNSPPPSDPLVPPSSPTTENTGPARKKLKAVLTPRKFTRFFTPRSQTTTQHHPGPSALQPLPDSALNTQPESSNATLSDPAHALASPASVLASSPLNPSTKRKRTSSNTQPEATTASSTRPQSTEPTTPRTQRPGSSGTQRNDSQVHDNRAGPVHLHLPYSGPAYLTSGTSQTIAPIPLDFGRDRPSTPAVTTFFKSKRPRATAIQKEVGAESQSKPEPSADLSIDVPGYQPQSFIKLRNRGMGAQLLLREQGMTSRPGRQHLQYVEHDTYAETSRFFSRSTDWDMCATEDPEGGPAKTSIPFSLASSHKRNLTAVGDEDGVVRMFDTNSTPASGGFIRDKFSARFKVHENAIMDLAFSDDDLRLATACGDRTGKIIDTVTSMVAAEMNLGHEQAMRRVKFQPGQANGNILATCDKAGRIQIWDLRLGSMPVDAFTTIDRSSGRKKVRHRNPEAAPFNVGIYNTFDQAHTRKVRNKEKVSSVTALQYMGAGREHLLLSASENDSRIKLWDTRYLNRRNQTTVPLSGTAPPANHAWRDFGITSLALNTDTSRLYAVCKDSTVYAYSTAHLMLGSAPELSTRPPRQRIGQDETGLAPLYGFQHSNLAVRSFYVRCAIRPTTLGYGPELLAVGSSTGCAVLFPTDESTLREVWERESVRRHDPRRAHVKLHTADGNTVDIHTPSSTAVTDPYSPAFRYRRVTKRPASRRDSTGTLPVVWNGTSLAGAHRREVTGVSWARDGKLVTISDDMTVRHWQEKPTRGLREADDIPRDARDLRVDRKNDTKSHYAGWARTRFYWDKEDDDSPLV